MTLTLTFDNGPDAKTTPYVLDLLRERGILCTFFVIGAKIRERNLRIIAERAFHEGHRIGNHSFSHDIQLGEVQPAERAVAEIDRAQQAMGPLAGTRKLFRPFGGGGELTNGLLNLAAVDYLQKHRFTVALWNSVPRDWERPVTWTDFAMQDVAAVSHCVTVLHDLPTGAMRELGRFLDRIDRQGIPVVQDFPESVLVLRDGVPHERLWPLVKPATRA